MLVWILLINLFSECMNVHLWHFPEYRPIPAATKQAEEEETQRETEHKEEEKPKGIFL